MHHEGFAMRLRASLVWVFALLVLPVGGCVEVAPPTTAPFTVIARDPELEIFLEGVEVCETDTKRCEMTNAVGEATLEFPLDEPHSITATKEGYASYLVPNVLKPENWWARSVDLPMASAARLAAEHGRIGAPYPMRDTGSVVVHLEQEHAGATFELVGATGTAFYHDEEGHWSPDLSATTSWARGGFAEVGHGDFQVNIGGTAWRCIPFNAWPGNDNDSISFRVREGHLTVASVRCAER